jgi:hypothetical protein
MITKGQAAEILQALTKLPTEKVAEVQDFIFFLNERYSSPITIDENDMWTDEDIEDLLVASMNYAAQTE